MPHEEALNFGTYLQMGLFVLLLVFFLFANFIVRPVELNQFDFGKRIQLTFSSMQGEENFFSKPGHKKLKTYRIMWIVLLVLMAALLGVSLWVKTL